jgi:hypothetical protein
MREISAIDAEIEAAEAKLSDLKRERTAARLPDGYQALLLAAFAKAFHDADNSYSGGSEHVELADGVNVHINVSVSDVGDENLSDDF